MKKNIYGSVATFYAIIGIVSILFMDRYFLAASVMTLIGFVAAVAYGELAQECAEKERLAKLADDCYDYMY